MTAPVGTPSRADEATPIYWQTFTDLALAQLAAFEAKQRPPRRRSQISPLARRIFFGCCVLLAVAGFTAWLVGGTW